MASPIGLQLGKDRARIGELIGTGAFGCVHAVVFDDNDDDDDDDDRRNNNNKNNKNSNKNNKNGSKKQHRWAVKLTAVPTKVTKRGDSEAEVAHMRLWSEYLLYSQHFRHLSLQNLIPKLPAQNADGLALYHDNMNGYRCLVMERMDERLFDALAKLVDEAFRVRSRMTMTAGEGGGGGRTAMLPLHLGPICAKLLDMCEAVHATGHILLDIKPDNLMVVAPAAAQPASTTASKSKSSRLTTTTTTTATATKTAELAVELFANRIRLLDFGLVKAIGGPHGHKDNAGAAAVQGTPLYAGLNVHGLHTPSRRDDVEALLYLVGDLVLTVQGLVAARAAAAHRDTAALRLPRPPVRYGRGETASYLPWSQETSDAAIGKAKAAQVEDPESDYYSAMDPPSNAAALYAAHRAVREYKYSATPHYDSLRRLLASLHVQIPAVAAAANNKNKKQRGKAASGISSAVPTGLMRRSTSTTIGSGGDKAVGGAAAVLALPSRRSPRRVVPLSSSAADGEQPPTSRRRRYSAREEAESSAPSKMAKKTTTASRYKMDESDFDSDVSMQDAAANDDHDESFCEVVEPEDMMVDDDDVDCRKPAAKTTQFRGVKLIIKGPGYTETILLVEGSGTESIVVGSKPTSVNRDEKTVIIADDALEASHVRLTLSTKHNGVQVDPLSKKSGVQVNRLNVPASGTTAFCAQGIAFANVIVEVQNLRKEEYAVAAATAAADESLDENQKPAAETTALRGVKLDIKGPAGFNETFVLMEGEIESVVLGKNPSSSRTNDGHDLIAVMSDPSLFDSHVRLTLSKNHEGVQVDPLSKNGVVQVNRMKVAASGTTAFVNQVIAMGETIVCVNRLRASDKEESVGLAVPAQSPRSSSSGRTTRAMAIADANVASTANSPLPKKKSPTKVKARHRAIVKISSGPFAGDELVLEQGVCDTIVIGSAPTRKGHPLKLSSNKGVAPDHALLDLVVNGDTVMVKVTDLKSDGGTIVNGKRLASGKNDMAFCGSSNIQVGDTVLQILRA